MDLDKQITITYTDTRITFTGDNGNYIYTASMGELVRDLQKLFNTGKLQAKDFPPKR